MISAVLFDAYGTIFDVYSIASTSEAAFPGNGARLAALWRDKQIEYTRLRTLCNRYVDFWQVTADALEFSCDELKIVLTDAARDRLMNEYASLTAYPENAAALAQLKEERLPLGILSNGTAWMLKRALDASGLAQYFDHVISVDRVRKFKTAPEAYGLGPKALGLPAGDILFVSSNGWDVSGAAWFGYQSFWLNRLRRPLERLGVAPDATGDSMDAVAAYVVGRRIAGGTGRSGN
jgi:2-haloacid dehalogenase